MENTKPFIKLFKTPIGFYCYDVNTFSMLRITEGMYEILNGNDEYDKEDARNRINKLKEKGYLSNHRPKEMKHPYTDYLQSYLSHSIRKITLQITQNCNLSCRYCAYANPIEGHQRSHSNRSMTVEIAKKCIDYLYSHSANESDINIGFYGGEPLLEFNKIKQLMIYANEFAKKYNKNLTYSLTTNATVFTDEIIEYFLSQNIHVVLSIDGPEDIHNKNRFYRNSGKGCFDDVMHTLERIRDKYPQFIEQLAINAVLDPENSFTCYSEFFTNYETIKDIKKSINSINKSNLATSFNFADKYFELVSYERFKLLLAMLKVICINDVSNIITPIEPKIKRLANSFNSIWTLPDSFHHGGPCIPGSGRLFIDIWGNFFPCERCSEASKVMKIGDIYHGIDISSVSNMLNIGRLTEKECINCWNVKHCLICATKADGITSYDRKKKLENCIIAKKTTKDLIYDYLALREFDYDHNERRQAE